MHDENRTPSKPKPTAATTAQLLEHYNKQVIPYNLALTGLPEDRRQDLSPQVELADPPSREELIDLIRKQNHRLGRHIKARSHELLLEHVKNEDGTPALHDGRYSLGHTYQHILGVLAQEFPEASTSVACLRWYVVHMRSDATDEGLPWPDLPQKRPRSPARAVQGAAL